MAMMMIFEDEPQGQYDYEKFLEKGFNLYACSNIYQFLKYAKEVKPDVVIMNFSPKFRNDLTMMNKIKDMLCNNNICPQIYLNAPKNFEGEIFFEEVDFKNGSAEKRLMRQLLNLKTEQKYKN